MPARRLLRGLVAAYVVALGASWIWRQTHPAELRPRPGERVVTLAAVQGDRQLPQRPVRMIVTDTGSAGASTALPVLLIQGSPGSKGEVAPLAGLLAADRRALAPDLPGFGHSTRSIPDYSFRAHAHYLLAALDSLRLARVHLVGFSMGGGVAITMADLAPARVASLTLLSAIGAQEYELLGDYHLNRALHGIQLAALWLLRETVPHFGALDRTFFGVEYARNFYDSDQRPLRAALTRYQGPALIIQGQRDVLVNPAVAREHHRIVPQSELVMFDDRRADHFMTFTRPADVAAPIAAFLARVDQGEALTRADAPADRVAAAARPFNPATLPRAAGLTLLVLLMLIAAATLVSEDLACIATGLMVGRGTLGFGAGTLACFVGIVAGDLALYAAGRYLGRRAVGRAPFRWVLSEARLHRSSVWFSRHGPWIALVTRFVPGTRLPTYVAAGVLKTRALAFLGVFLVAAALWTPLLVGASALFGIRVVGAFTSYQQWALPTVLALAAGLFLVLKLLVPLASWRGRRLLLSRWRRLTRWEFWPQWAFYPPVVLYILWLALRYRSLTIWTASNPAIPGGGFVGESKAAILEGLNQAPDRVARWILLPAGATTAARLEQVRAFVAETGIGFPVVLKPDVGERGSGVAIVPDEAGLRNYLETTPGAVLAQEYVPGVEFGVFYYRMPGEPTGQILAITDKRFPTVTGDGRRTLETLILADDRAVCMAAFFLEQHARRLEEVPAAGQVVPLVELGTHARGAAFYDGEWVRTPELERAIDGLSRLYDGFWFGRYDLRAPTADAIRAGTGFKVIELNGSGAEATNIYDPTNRLGQAYQVLRRQWAIAFEIGARNVAAGARATSLRELLGLLASRRRAIRSHFHFDSR